MVNKVINDIQLTPSLVYEFGNEINFTPSESKEVQSAFSGKLDRVKKEIEANKEKELLMKIEEKAERINRENDA